MTVAAIPRHVIEKWIGVMDSFLQKQRDNLEEQKHKMIMKRANARWRLWGWIGNRKVDSFVPEAEAWWNSNLGYSFSYYTEAELLDDARKRLRRITDLVAAADDSFGIFISADDFAFLTKGEME